MTADKIDLLMAAALIERCYSKMPAPAPSTLSTELQLYGLTRLALITHGHTAFQNL